MSRLNLPVTLEKLQADVHIERFVTMDREARSGAPDWLPIGGGAYYADLVGIIANPSVLLSRSTRPGGIGFLQPVDASAAGSSIDTRYALYAGLLVALLQHGYKHEPDFLAMRIALLPLLLKENVGVFDISSIAAEFNAFRREMGNFAQSLETKPTLTEPQAVMVCVILKTLQAVQAEVNALGFFQRGVVNGVINLKPLLERFAALREKPVQQAVVMPEAPEAVLDAVLLGDEAKSVGQDFSHPAAEVVPVEPAPPAHFKHELRRVVAEYIRNRSLAKDRKKWHPRLALFSSKGFGKYVKIGAARHLLNAIDGRNRADSILTKEDLRADFDYRLTCGALCQGDLFRKIKEALPPDLQRRLDVLEAPEAKVQTLLQACSPVGVVESDVHRVIPVR